MTRPTQADLGPGDTEPTRCCGRAAICCTCGPFNLEPEWQAAFDESVRLARMSEAERIRALAERRAA